MKVYSGYWAENKANYIIFYKSTGHFNVFKYFLTGQATKTIGHDRWPIVISITAVRKYYNFKA